MRKQIILISILIISSFTRCTDYLDKQPLASPSSETFLSNETEVLLGVESCYQYLDQRYKRWYDSFQRGLVNLEDAGMTRINPEYNNFRQGNADPQYGIVRSYYQLFYKGVARCHITIEGMEKAKDEMDTHLWNRLRSEARIIRAWCYYNLVCKFGDIPFTTTQLEMADYADLQRTPEDEVYEYILNEIEDAAQYLPDSYTGDDMGRITKGAAYAVGAKAAVYRAFFHNGQAITPDENYLNKVVEYTQKIIDSGAHELFYSPTDPKNSYKKLFTYEGENSKEVILQKEFNFGEGSGTEFCTTATASSSFPNSFGAVTPQEYLVASYEDTLGNTVDQSPYYDPKDPFAGREPRFYQTIVWPRVEGDQDIEVELTTHNGVKILKGYNEVYHGAEFSDILDPNLTREFKTLNAIWGNKVGKDYDYWNWYTDNEGISHLYDNRDATSPFATFTGYLTWKYWSFEDFFEGNERNSSLNLMLIRFADILLLNAEARIELGTDLAKAAEYINMVRARGWGMNLNEYLNHPSAVSAAMGQDSLRAKVRRERKIELCFEGTRYEDLKRYGAAVKALSGHVVGRPKFFHLEADTHIPQIDENGVVSLLWLEGLSGSDVKFPNRWHSFSDYKEHYNRWPIPQTEFDNGNMSEEDQNPGY